MLITCTKWRILGLKHDTWKKCRTSTRDSPSTIGAGSQRMDSLWWRIYSWRPDPICFKATWRPKKSTESGSLCPCNVNYINQRKRGGERSSLTNAFIYQRERQVNKPSLVTLHYADPKHHPIVTRHKMKFYFQNFSICFNKQKKSSSESKL